MKTRVLTLATLVITSALATSAFAGAASSANPQAGDWLIRARAIGVIPDESSDLSVAAEAKVDNNYVPEFDFTYFLTQNWALELIAAVSPHDVSTDTGIDAGSAWLLPPTLTLQYHFTDFDGFKPYVGAGINYTHFFNEKGSAALGTVDYDDSFGPAFQVGVDVPIAENTYANLDVKKVFINTDAAWSGGVTADVDIDPWIIGVGVGYRF